MLGIKVDPVRAQVIVCSFIGISGLTRESRLELE